MLFLSLALAGLALAQEKAAPLAMLQAASCPADVGHEGHLLFKRVQLQAHSQTQAERKAAVEQAVHLGQQQKYVGGTPGGAGSYQEILLSHHNSYRAAHGAGPLSWNDQAAGFAQAMADTCVFEHSSPPRTFGENIAQGYLDFTSAVGAWYAEHPLYNGDFTMAAGHFSQLVWKSTTSVGCGYRHDCGLLFCEYYPPGNVMGAFHYNVAV